jgi:protein-arginine kinase activator protein McsA
VQLRSYPHLNHQQLSKLHLRPYRSFPNIGRKPKTNNNSLESLKQQLDKAVEKEDFQLAIYLRDKIKTFERDQEEIKKIEDELKDCIKSQNFEKAIELRDQLQKMRP